MDKSWYASKAIWGFGIAGVIALGQVLGVSYSESTVVAIVQILSTFFGVYGIRDALD